MLTAYQLKEASVKDARATPPTMGTSEETTQKEGFCWRIPTQTEAK